MLGERSLEAGAVASGGGSGSNVRPYADVSWINKKHERGCFCVVRT
jgi:hypothetical protein